MNSQQEEDTERNADVNNNKSYLTSDKEFPNNKNHLTTDETSRVVDFHRWNLTEFNMYMKIAIFFSLLPLPMSGHAVFIGIKRDLWGHYIFDFAGLLLLLYRLFLLIYITLYPKIITIEYVEKVITVIKSNFLFYFVESCLIMANYDPNDNQIGDDDDFDGSSQDIYAPLILRPGFLSTYVWTAIIYFIVNVLLTFPDLFILRKLLFFLNYNFDGHDEYNDSFDHDDDFAFQLDLDLPSVQERKTELDLRKVDIELSTSRTSSNSSRPISVKEVLNPLSNNENIGEIKEN
jgi:hypothetical protein